MEILFYVSLPKKSTWQVVLFCSVLDRAGPSRVVLVGVGRAWGSRGSRMKGLDMYYLKI